MNDKGYSLIEILVAMALLSIVFIPVTQLVIQGIELHMEARKITENLYESQSGIEDERLRVHENGESITETSIGSEITIQNPDSMSRTEISYTKMEDVIPETLIETGEIDFAEINGLLNQTSDYEFEYGVYSSNSIFESIDMDDVDSNQIDLSISSAGQIRLRLSYYNGVAEQTVDNFISAKPTDEDVVLRLNITDDESLESMKLVVSNDLENNIRIFLINDRSGLVDTSVVKPASYTKGVVYIVNNISSDTSIPVVGNSAELYEMNVDLVDTREGSVVHSVETLQKSQ